MKDKIKVDCYRNPHKCNYCGKMKRVKWIGATTYTMFCSKRCLKKWLKAP